MSFEDPNTDAWESTTQNILEGAFEKPQGVHDRRTQEFLAADGGPLRIGMSAGEHQRNFVRRLQKQKALLEAFLEQIDDSIPPAQATAEGSYRFHPTLEHVSGNLFRDGHYKQAALEAFICVIDEVKRRVDLPDLDGERLMNKAFAFENQKPVLRFNSLQTDSERDEQKGLFFLFKGLVSLRNAKAHSNRLFNDPARAHEYLALASLLMQLLETAGQ